MRLPVELGLLAGGVVISIAAGVWIARKRSPTAEARERRRRLAVNLRGRIGDAFITDVNENTLFYTYAFRGVEYTTAQDISAIRDIVPHDPSKLIGPATLKFLPGNPANSILVCEDWSGLVRF